MAQVNTKKKFRIKPKSESIKEKTFENKNIISSYSLLNWGNLVFKWLFSKFPFLKGLEDLFDVLYLLVRELFRLFFLFKTLSYIRAKLII